jgi:hypothetical protein
VLAAVLAAGIYSQSLLVIGGAPLLNQGAAYWALPAALWCVQRHLDGRRLGAPLLAAVVALTLLGSHPQQALIAGAPAALYALYAAVRWPGARTRGALLPLAGAALVGGTVAAVRLLPTLSLLGASARAGGLEFSASALGSVNPLALVSGMLLPSLDLPFGLLRPQWTAYLGPLPLLLCLFGLRRVRAERSGPFVDALGLTGVLLTLGSYTPLYWVISRTPLLSYFREPSRFLLWTVQPAAVRPRGYLDARVARQVGDEAVVDEVARETVGRVALDGVDQLGAVLIGAVQIGRSGVVHHRAQARFERLLALVPPIAVEERRDV